MACFTSSILAHTTLSHHQEKISKFNAIFTILHRITGQGTAWIQKQSWMIGSQKWIHYCDIAIISKIAKLDCTAKTRDSKTMLTSPIIGQLTDRLSVSNINIKHWVATWYIVNKKERKRNITRKGQKNMKKILP